MKKCRTVNGLHNSLKKGENATLLIWDILPNQFDAGGAYLNMGGGAYSYVGKETWESIRNHVVEPDGEFYKNKTRYRHYYSNTVSA